MDEKMEYIQEDIADFIIRNSRDGKIVTLAEIEASLVYGDEDQATDISQILESIGTDLDLKKIDDAEGNTFYYSGNEMTDKYAGIIIRVKDKDILKLIGDTVREESRRYPRPTYVTMFNLPPYNLTEGELTDMLSELSNDSEYADLKFTNASNGTLFVYSNKHMSKGYADYLAEWIEVGQDENP
jgi:hypothetical protein